MAKNDRTYSISELAREFAVTARALRFYEDKALLAPRRDGLNRIYSARDRARLQLILRGKRLGFPLIEIKELLDLYDADKTGLAQLRVALPKYRARLAALLTQRDDVEQAIEQIRDAIVRIEDMLAQGAAPAAADAARAFDQVARQRLEGAS
ncbi:MAG: MerR family DNA-binding transcriptional regulator [Hyphomonadaceae bacterium]